jgi:hypothetical protein
LCQRITDLLCVLRCGIQHLFELGVVAHLRTVCEMPAAPWAGLNVALFHCKETPPHHLYIWIDGWRGHVCVYGVRGACRDFCGRILKR